MRPISLKMSAFGPYSKEMPAIDFSNFSDDGLFLITGNTGAGKTMIFDAICFALYGEMSGNYRKTKHLRSEFAADDVESYVEFEFSHQGETYKVKRTPAYTRKSKRGSGLTEISETAELTQLGDSDAVEGKTAVNKAIYELLKININQFRQMVMIAQGEFRELLNSSTEKRTEILRTIFLTNGYKNMEINLRNKEKESRELRQKLQDSIIQYFDGIEVDESSALYEEIAALKQKVADTKSAWYTDEIIEILEKILEEDTEGLNASASILAEKEQNLKEKEALFIRAEQDNKLVQQLEELEKKQKSLEAQKSEFDEKKLILKKYQLASRVLRPVYDSWREWNVQVSNQKREIEEIEKEKEKVQAEALFEKNENEVAKKKMSELTGEYSKKREALKGSSQKLELVRNEIEVLNKLLTEIEELISDKQINREEKRKILEEKQKCFEEAQSLYEKATKEKLHAEKIWENNQAGIMASKLAKGEVCPVCGATEHPKLALISGEEISEMELNEYREQEQAANDAKAKALVTVTSAKTDFEKHEELMKEIAVKLISDPIIGETTSATKLDDLIMQLSNVSVKLNNTKTEKEQLADEIMVACEQYDLADNVLKYISDMEVDAEIPSEVVSAKERLVGTQKAKEKADADVIGLNSKLETLKDELEKKQSQEKSTNENLLSSLKKNGFASLENMEEFLMDEEVLVDYEEKIKNYDIEVETNKNALDNAKNNAEGKTIVDIKVLEDEKEAASAEAITYTKAHRIIENRINTNKTIKTNIEKVKPNFDNANKAHSLCKKLYLLVSGQFSGAKITLEQYVQAAGFDSILNAANDRFLPMTGNQYQLFRQEETTSEQSKTFLDLEVFDNVTGKKRPVSDLSGGESFKASLSLALGLSDTISASTGGVQMDALFVDEGFGSLDAKSIESTIETLLDLSNSNKLVGIISHREELMQIPQQIRVEKTKDGSSFSVQFS